MDAVQASVGGCWASPGAPEPAGGGERGRRLSCNIHAGGGHCFQQGLHQSRFLGCFSARPSLSLSRTLPSSPSLPGAPRFLWRRPLPGFLLLGRGSRRKPVPRSIEAPCLPQSPFWTGGSGAARGPGRLWEAFYLTGQRLPPWKSRFS